MITFYFISTFAAGVSLGSYLMYKLRRPTTVNKYSGTVKNKVKGRNNTQEIHQKAEINGDMGRREVIKIWKSLRK